MKRTLMLLLLCVALLVLAGCQGAHRHIKYDGFQAERVDSPERVLVVEIERSAQ